MRKKRIMKVKYGLLELEKCFKELKDREWKHRVIKIKKEMEELFFRSMYLWMKLINLNKKKL